MNRIQGKMLLQLVLASATIVAAVLAIGAAGSGASSPPGLSSVSNQGGPPVMMSPGGEPILAAAASHGLAIAPIRPMGNAGEATFYRVGEACFAYGPGFGAKLSAFVCSVDFPSETQPMIVDIKRRGTSADDPGRITTVQGIAADGVAAVGFQDTEGNVLGKTSITDNLFQIATVLPGSLKSLVAFGATGSVIYVAPIG